MIGILSKNYLWMRTLGSTPMNERENRERFSERIVQNVASKLAVRDSQGLAAGRGFGGGGAAAAESALAKPTTSAAGLAVEGCEGQITQIAKKAVFG